MPKSTLIKLKEPVFLHDQHITELRFREPTGGQYLDIGEPRMLARNVDGTLYWVEDREAIKRYVDACLDHEFGGPIIRLLGLADAKLAKDTVLGFFTTADQETSSA